jgi:hypothetical protein
MVTQADIDALNELIAQGTRSVTIGDQTVTNNTTASLIQARDDMVRQLARQEAKEAAKVRPRQKLIMYAGRGY